MHLADNRILVVLVSASDIIYNKIVRIDENLSQDELERTARYLNAEFVGKSLHSIRAEIVAMMREEKALYDTLLRHAMLLCDAERMRELFRTFEEKSRLVKILNECVARSNAFPGNVQIVIGREHIAPSMQDCALITAPYRTGDGTIIGTLGVVGPVRIEYERMVAVVNYVARLVERLLHEEPAST